MCPKYCCPTLTFVTDHFIKRGFNLSSFVVGTFFVSKCEENGQFGWSRPFCFFSFFRNEWQTMALISPFKFLRKIASFFRPQNAPTWRGQPFGVLLDPLKLSCFQGSSINYSLFPIEISRKTDKNSFLKRKIVTNWRFEVRAKRVLQISHS